MLKVVTNLLLVSISLLLVSACSDDNREVPMPETQSLIDIFQDHQQDANTLASMIRDSSYDGIDMTSEGVVEGFWFEKPLVDGQSAYMEKVPTPEDWIPLLENLEVDSVHSFEDEYVELRISPKDWNGDFPGSARYEYSETIDSRNRVCRTTRTQNACGQCIVDLGDNWWLVLKWAPWPFISELAEVSMRTDLTESQKREAQDRLLFDCYVRGGTQINPELRDWSSDAS